MQSYDFEHLKELFSEYQKMEDWCYRNRDTISMYHMEELSNEAMENLKKDIYDYVRNMIDR